MAVTLPSDLLVGVMKAASTERLAKSMEKLTNTQPGPSAFVAALDAVAPGRQQEDLIASVLAAADDSKSEAATYRLAALQGGGSAAEAADAHRGLEAALIRNMMELMLPAGNTDAFGGGHGGPFWRSLAADQFASLYSDAGGLGIAEELGKRYEPTESSGPRSLNQWPYIQSETITSFTG